MDNVNDGKWIILILIILIIKWINQIIDKYLVVIKKCFQISTVEFDIDFGTKNESNVRKKRIYSIRFR